MHPGGMALKLNSGNLKWPSEAVQPDSNIANRGIDLIDQRYGELAVALAHLLNCYTMPNFIALSWKPSGHRETIVWQR